MYSVVSLNSSNLPPKSCPTWMNSSHVFLSFRQLHVFRNMICFAKSVCYYVLPFCELEKEQEEKGTDCKLDQTKLK